MAPDTGRRRPPRKPRHPQHGQALAGPSAPTGRALDSLARAPGVRDPRLPVHCLPGTLVLAPPLSPSDQASPDSRSQEAVRGRVPAGGHVCRLLGRHEATLGSFVALTASSGWSHQKWGVGWLPGQPCPPALFRAPPTPPLSSAPTARAGDWLLSDKALNRRRRGLWLIKGPPSEAFISCYSGNWLF